MFLIISSVLILVGMLGLLLSRSQAGCIVGGCVVLIGVASLIFVR